MSVMSNQQKKREQVKFVLENITNKVDEVARMAQISERSVFRIKSKLQNREDIKRKSGSGRKSKLGPIDNRRIGRIVNANPRLSNIRIAHRISQLGSPRVSRETIGRRLKKLGLTRFKPLRVPFLTATHKAKRLEFCRNFMSHDWSKTIFSDESTIQLFVNHRKVLGKSRPNLPAPKYSPKLMVWGGISLRGIIALKICRRSMDSDEYILTLDQFLMPMASILFPDGFEFQQDNATCHTSKLTRDFMDEHQLRVIEWPPNSPDLNPIENAWGLIKNKLSCFSITSLIELEDKISKFGMNSLMTT